MNLTLKVVLPTDRTKTGTLTLVHPQTGLVLFGPVPVLGRAARNAASAQGNPTGDALKPYGDTPKGTYKIGRILGNGDGTSRPISVYGQSGSITLEPTSGDALTAKQNGRIGILDYDMSQLISAIKDSSLLFPGEVTVEVGGAPGPQGDIDESVEDGDPPPTQGGPVLLP